MSLMMFGGWLDVRDAGNTKVSEKRVSVRLRFHRRLGQFCQLLAWILAIPLGFLRRMYGIWARVSVCGAAMLESERERESRVSLSLFALGRVESRPQLCGTNTVSVL